MDSDERWRWDPNKDRLNRAKHGLSLATGIFALRDPYAVSVADPHADGDRWKTIGLAEGILLVVVIHTENDSGGGRLISVRRATPRERRTYEEGTFDDG